MPISFLEGTQTEPIAKPFTLRGFDGNACQSVRSSAKVCLQLGGAELSGKFFICETSMGIIGCDLLRDKQSGISMDTRSGLLKVDDASFQTDTDQTSAILSLRRRMNIDEKEIKVNWARLRSNVVIPSHKSVLLRLECDRKSRSTDRCVFLSLMDEDFDRLYIPSILISPDVRNFAVFARNQSEADVSLMKGTRLGRIAGDSDTPSHSSVCVFDADDMAFAMEEMSDAVAASATVTDAVTDTVTDVVTDAVTDAAKGPVPLSELVEVNKVTNEVLNRVHGEGVKVDLELDVPSPNVCLDFDASVDVAKEASRSDGCEFWPDRDAFLSQFRLEVNDDETESKLKEMLWSYRHVFINERFPHQFHEGIRVPPITIPLKSDPPPPRKERPRRPVSSPLEGTSLEIRIIG